jgi:hypothetical protein
VTTVAIHQPNYLPWLGYFAKIRHSDVLVLLDNVQYPKRSYVTRVQVKTPTGAAWLSQPVLTVGRYTQQIREVEFAEPDWARAHVRTLQSNYARAPFFCHYFEELARALQERTRLAAECNARLIEWICRTLHLTAEVVWASELHVEEADPTRRLIGMVRAVGGDTYISGSGGFKYQDLGEFERATIRVLRAPGDFPEYPQLWGEFVSGLSIVDALFNCGPECRRYLDLPPIALDAPRRSCHGSID